MVYVDTHGDKGDIIPTLKAASPSLKNMVIVRGACGSNNPGGKSSVDPVCIYVCMYTYWGLGIMVAATGATVADF